MKSVVIFRGGGRAGGAGGGWADCSPRAHSLPSLCGFVAEPPSVPLSLAVEEVTENSVTLTWKAPEHTGKSSLDGYVVEICKDGSRFGLSGLVSMESGRSAAEVWDGAGWNLAAPLCAPHFPFFVPNTSI